jgi:hypothetical protein
MKTLSIQDFWVVVSFVGSAGSGRRTTRRFGKHDFKPFKDNNLDPIAAANLTASLRRVLDERRRRQSLWL